MNKKLLITGDRIVFLTDIFWLFQQTVHYQTTLYYHKAVHIACALRVFEIWSHTVEAHARASNSQREADDCLPQAGWLPRLKWKRFKTVRLTVQWAVIALVSHASPSYEFASLGLLRRVLRASLQRDPCVEGADQSRPYPNASVVQCFRRSSVVGRGNALVSRYLRPKSIADTLSITLFKSIGDNSIDIEKIWAIKYRQYSILRY